MIEQVFIDNERVAVIIRKSYRAEKTTFISEPDDLLQLGHILYRAGSAITPHIHNNIERKILGTPEVLIVQKGKMKTTFYNNKKEPKEDVVLNKGDVIILLSGGHGFEMIEDTVLMEIKQGPYLGELDKERF